MIRVAPQWQTWASHLPALPQLGSPELGADVVTHRTSWVRRFYTPAGIAFVKTYEYARWSDLIRSLSRRSLPFAASRARREFDAMNWLNAHGLLTATPLLAAEWRTAGILRRALLVSAAAAGEPATTVLDQLPDAARADLARAIGRFVAALHATGFRDGNLDLRNLIVAPATAGWSIAKIDSPRHRLVRAGPGEDRHSRADWARLTAQLERWSLATIARGVALVPAALEADRRPRTVRAHDGGAVSPRSHRGHPRQAGRAAAA
ncbi:MAG: lipopolysaccharide kinase InaA family protein, partial [Planctomycetes bacterium]|nr:lipopolysaccharide kinase InaA family protein [Planctomycetota bacterium]